MIFIFVPVCRGVFAGVVEAVAGIGSGMAVNALRGCLLFYMTGQAFQVISGFEAGYINVVSIRIGLHLPDMFARERIAHVTVAAGRREGSLTFGVASGAVLIYNPVSEAVMVADRTAFRDLHVEVMVEFNPRKKVGERVYHHRRRRFIIHPENRGGDQNECQDYPAQDAYRSTFHSSIPP